MGNNEVKILTSESIKKMDLFYSIPIISSRYSAIVPAHVNGILKIIEKLNSTIYETAKESIDSVSSIAVIVGLILFLICAPIFMGFQVIVLIIFMWYLHYVL